MAETCYSRGKKIILMPEQNKNGTWICRFTIPELRGSNVGGPHDAYKTEWEAKTAAFESAKRVLEART
jgi:hypothetical protein